MFMRQTPCSFTENTEVFFDELAFSKYGNILDPTKSEWANYAVQA